MACVFPPNYQDAPPVEPVDNNPDKLQDFWEWLVENRTQVVLAIVIALGAGMIYYVGKIKDIKAEEAGAGELHAVLSPNLELAGTADELADSEKFQAVVADNPETASAVNAAYMNASALFKERDYAEAEKAFQVFYSAYTTHTLTPGALFGIAASRHAQGGDAKSVQGAYQEVITQHPSSPESNQARVALARALLETDRDQAKKLIEALPKEDDQFVLAGFWATEAARLESLLKSPSSKPEGTGEEPEEKPVAPNPGLPAPGK